MKKILLIMMVLFSFSALFGQTVDREFFNAEKLFFQKKYNFAREAFLLYLKKRPLSTNDMLYYYIGACYFQDKQYENAINYYKLAFDIKDSYSYCNNIANSYYQLKNYDEALIWYRRSIDRIYSPYDLKLNYNEETNSIVFKNVVTNTVFIGNVLSFFTNIISDISVTNAYSIESNETEVIKEDSENETEATNIINNLDNSKYDTNFNDDNFTPSLNESMKELDIVNENIKTLAKSTFTKLPLFTNEVLTNTFTNIYTFTNITISFTPNTNFSFEVIGLETNSLPTSPATVGTLKSGDIYTVTNIVIMTNVVSNGNLIEIKTNVASLDKYNTEALYYSAYLNMGHAFLALGEITNAAISYEIFLTNVGDNYYQKDSLEKVINIIRSNDNSVRFIPFTNNFRITTNNDGIITKESVGSDFSYNRESFFTNETKVEYIKNGVEKMKMYSNNYEISQTVYPYGKTEIETIYDNGTIKLETYLLDNTKSINTKTKDGDIYEYIEYADGSFINKKISDKNNSMVIERSDGSIITNYKKGDETFYYNRALDGSEMKRTEKPGGEVITETKRIDGTMILKDQKGDGSYVLTVSYNDGSISTTKTDTNGISKTQIIYPNARTEDRVSKNGTLDTLTYNIKSDDGSIITKTFNDDGSFTIETRKTDGTIIKEIISDDVVSEIRKPDGTVVNRTVRKDGSSETTTVNKDLSSNTEIISSDGSSLSTSINKDGSSVSVTKDIDGNVETVRKDREGNLFKSEVYKDGRTVTTEEKVNGVIITSESDSNGKITMARSKDGYVLEIKEITGKDPIVTIVDSNGNPVLLETAENIIKETGLNITVDMVQNISKDLKEDSLENKDSEEVEGSVEEDKTAYPATNPPSLPAS